MKRKIRYVPGWIFVLVIGVLLFEGPADAAERTGEILKELLKEVEDRLEKLERETKGAAEQAELLMAEMQETRRAFDTTQNPVKKQEHRADLYAKAAKLNDLDRREVGATLGAIVDVRGSLDKIRATFQQPGFMPPQEALPRFRRKMGDFITNVANVLDGWASRATPEGQQEVAQLKGVLVSLVPSLQETTNLGSSQNELQRTLRTVDATYAQLITLERVLEHERRRLQGMTQVAYLELVLTRLTNGRLTVRSVPRVVHEKVRRVGQRRELLRGTEGPLVGGATEGTSTTLDADTTATLERMKRGQVFE